MKPFARATVPESEVELVIRDMTEKWKAGDPTIRSLFPTATDELSAAKEIDATVREQHARDSELVFINDVYQVSIRKLSDNFVHLSIKRIDRDVIHDWRDLQEIKNQLVGPECEGLELYPAESRIVDTANQYHLWCVLDSTYRFPFGFDNGRIVSNYTIGKSKQRSRE